MKANIVDMIYATLNYPEDDYKLINSVVDVAFGDSPEEEMISELKGYIFKAVFMLRTFNKINDKEAYKLIANFQDMFLKVVP